MSAPAETIFALSSGRPPAAIAVVRLTGPLAGPALDLLIGDRPQPRRARLAEVLHPDSGELLDRALILWMPGPESATGEDVAELHLHGGRAIVDAVLESLASLAGVRGAEPGEFTRRAFENGRIDLNEAEGLADLLAAETQSQRRAAQLAAGGALSARIAGWRTRLLDMSAAVEANIDFSDEEDVPQAGLDDARLLAGELQTLLSRPPAERLRDGVRVVIAGPPNAGKSSLLNVLAQREVAICSPVPGTTRDLVEAPLALAGIPVLLIDTAGLRESVDTVESIGIARASAAVEAADIVLWLGAGDDAPLQENVIRLHSRCDLSPGQDSDGRLPVSSVTGENVDTLLRELVGRAKGLLPAEGEVALNRRQREAVTEMKLLLRNASTASDALIVAEELRGALRLCDRLSGRAGVEDMLDALFGRFCIGK